MALTSHPSNVFMELEQLRASFELQLEEFVSLLIKDYIGDVECPNAILLDLERTRNNTSLL